MAPSRASNEVMRTPPKDRTAKRCQYHCSGCGCHFISLRAFDLHRFGSWEERGCWGEDESRLAIAREDGICELDEPTRIGVTLWREHGPESCVVGNFPASGAESDPEPKAA
jgi:hypothetical protein